MRPTSTLGRASRSANSSTCARDLSPPKTQKTDFCTQGCPPWRFCAARICGGPARGAARRAAHGLHGVVAEPPPAVAVLEVPLPAQRRRRGPAEGAEGAPLARAGQRGRGARAWAGRREVLDPQLPPRRRPSGPRAPRPAAPRRQQQLPLARARGDQRCYEAAGRRVLKHERWDLLPPRGTHLGLGRAAISGTGAPTLSVHTVRRGCTTTVRPNPVPTASRSAGSSRGS
jgi:hypothetical protein